PIEGSAMGRAVIDGSVPCPEVGLLAAPVVLTFSEGAAREVTGAPEAARAVEALFASHGAQARVLGEFGIGLNPRALLSGRMLEDEGCRGTVHFGIGSNATIGDVNEVSFHLDF